MTMSPFVEPSSVVVDSLGNKYISDGQLNCIWVADNAKKVQPFVGDCLNPQTGTRDGVGKNAQFFAPLGMVFDGKRNIYVADTANHCIRAVDIVTKSVTTLAGKCGLQGFVEGSLSTARFRQPDWLVLGVGGQLLVSDRGNARVRAISLS